MHLCLNKLPLSNTTCILFHNSIRPQIQRFELVVNTLLPWLLGKLPHISAQKHNAKALSHVFPGAVVNCIFEPGCRSEARRSILARPSLNLLQLYKRAGLNIGDYNTKRFRGKGYLGYLILELIANALSFFNPFGPMECPIKFDIVTSRFSNVYIEGPQVITLKNDNIIFLSLTHISLGSVLWDIGKPCV